MAEELPAGSDLPHSAPRPYPHQYIWTQRLCDGSTVTLRPIRPEDEPMLKRFHETLSDQTVQFRYFHQIKLSRRVSHERLARICFNDYDRDIVIVVERRDPATDEPHILGVARLSKEPGGSEAEFAALVGDAWQHHGLGTELTRRCIQIAQSEGLRTVTASALATNREMQHIFQKLGFEISTSPEEGLITARISFVCPSEKSK